MNLHSQPPKEKPAHAFLSQIALFAGLTDAQLDQIIPCLHRRTYAHDVTLFHQDMPGNTLYILEEGCVRVFGLGPNGTEHTLNTFGPGDVFGELAVVDNKPRSATAITMLPATLWLIPQPLLEELIYTYPSVARAVIDLLASRVRTAASHVEALIFQDVLGRLAFELLTLAERHGRPTPEGLHIDLPLTQAELATIVGTTRESINKALMVLRARAWVDVDGTRFTVLDAEALRRMVEERGR